MALPIDWLPVGAALLAGLTGGVHCAAMCGGIATGFSAMGANSPNRLRAALEPNLGRILGYTVAGGIAGGIGGGILRVARSEWLSFGLRMLVGAVLVLVALRMFGVGGPLKLTQRPGNALWQRLRPLQARLLPADTTPKRLGLGVLWGWLPCGLSTSLLAAAWFTADARNGALTMAAFGLGTLPVMLPLTWAGARIMGRLQRGPWRMAAATVVLLAGAVTIAGPWLMQVPALHGPLAALGCQPFPG